MLSGQKKRFYNFAFDEFILWAGIIFILSLPISYYFVTSHCQYTVDSKPPDWLPVLIFSQEKAEIQSYQSISYYFKDNPSATFLVPAGKAASFSKILSEGNPNATYNIEVKESSSDRQLIEFSLYGDGRDTKVLYEARDKKITIKSYYFFSIIHVLEIIWWALVINMIVWFAISGLLKLSPKFRSQLSPKLREIIK